MTDVHVLADPDPGPVPPERGSAGAFVSGVLARLGADPRTAEIMPGISAIVQAMAPMFGVDAAEAAAGPPGDMAEFFYAVRDAVNAEDAATPDLWTESAAAQAATAAESTPADRVDNAAGVAAVGEWHDQQDSDWRGPAQGPNV